MTVIEDQETYIKRGDLKPDLVYYARDDSHEADLRLVESWRLIARNKAGEQVFVDSAPVVSVPDVAQPWRVALTHVWTSGQTAAVARLVVEAEAMWPGSKPQTFPSVYVSIKADLG